MKYKLINDVIDLVRQFELENQNGGVHQYGIEGFRNWLCKNGEQSDVVEEPMWEGKENGRSPDSVINTFIVHMNRYAKTYSKSAILGSDFSTQEDFIYLINLKAFGVMSKMELIRKNVHDKPAGMQIINRLIHHGWVEQTHSEADKRSKVLQITSKGEEVLEKQMDKIRKASQIVSGNLTHSEKMELIRLLSKLNEFHHAVYSMNPETSQLLDVAYNQLSKS